MFEFNSTLWQLFNFVVFIFLVCFLFNVLKKLRLKRQREEMIIEKLDELISINKKDFEDKSKR